MTMMLLFGKHLDDQIVPHIMVIGKTGVIVSGSSRFKSVSSDGYVV